MKILMCGNSFGPKKGGSQTYALEVATNMHKAGIEVVFMTRTQPDYEYFDSKLPFEVIRRHSKVALGALFFKMLKSRSFDAIYVTHRADFAALACTASRLFNKPYFISIYGGEILHDFRAKSVKRNLASARAVIAISNFTKELLAGLGVNEKKIHIIPCGTDMKRFNMDINPEPILNKHGLKGKSIILSVSRLVKRKGHANIIAGLPAILKEVPSVHYLIVGKGPEEESLKRQVVVGGLEESVTFAGFIGEDELPRYYAACDVFAMPSFAAHKGENVEGFGIAYLEANACGKPVIGGRTGGVEDAIAEGKTGLIVNPKEIGEIEGAIITILTNGELAVKMGVEGRRRVEEKFNWKSVTEEIIKLIKRMSN